MLRIVVIEAVDEELGIFGTQARDALYEYMERNFWISREDIPDNIDSFESCLNELFGASSAFIEERIVENICRRLDIDKSPLEQMNLKQALVYLRQYIPWNCGYS